MAKYIKVKTQFVGFHQYIDAPEEVAFLRSLHRHLFLVSVKIQVIDLNRELEFFIVQRKVKEIISEYEGQATQTESCEMIAEFILTRIEKQYPNREIEVSVSEDGEDYAIVNNQ